MVSRFFFSMPVFLIIISGPLSPLFLPYLSRATLNFGKGMYTTSMTPPSTSAGNMEIFYFAKFSVFVCDTASREVYHAGVWVLIDTTKNHLPAPSLPNPARHEHGTSRES